MSLGVPVPVVTVFKVEYFEVEGVEAGYFEVAGVEDVLAVDELRRTP